MSKRRLNRRSQRQGFTLMEVLLVLVIIVVLAGFGIQAFQGTREKAKIREAKGMIGMISTGLKRYQIEVSTGLPESLEALSAQPSDVDPSEWVKILDKVPNDPWGKPYDYKKNGADFELRSAGPDGQVGTADDITP